MNRLGGVVLSVGIAVLLFAGCGLQMSHGGKAMSLQNPVEYANAFQKAVAVCRELNLPVILSDKDTGQVQCGLKTVETNFAGTGYTVDVLVEKEGDIAKRVDVKTRARSGIYSGPTSQADADNFADKYLDTLKRQGVQ